MAHITGPDSRGIVHPCLIDLGHKSLKQQNEVSGRLLRIQQLQLGESGQMIINTFIQSDFHADLQHLQLQNAIIAFQTP